MIETERTDIDGLLILTPKVFRDDRGYFFESYNTEVFAELGIRDAFLQDNESFSSKNVLRGLHFQAPPFDQGKLVRVVKGAVLDVAVDIRRRSPTYGRHVAVRLDATEKKMLWIPPGFAHGFLSLEDDTIFLYKCTHVYSKAAEGSVRWNDPDLAIDWGVSDPVVSPKDGEAGFFRDLVSPF